MFDLSSAPWHVGDIFDSLDDQYSYWNLLMNQVLDDHVPLRRMKVRAHDVPYMNRTWKKAIRMKKRYAKKYTTSPTEENLKQMKKWGNEATKLRRKAMKEYWKRKAEDFRTKPREFYKAFKPFLDTKVRGTDSRFINLEVNGIYERNQATVANHFASYFFPVAMDIGDPNLLTSTEEQLEDHPSVQAISQQREISRDGRQFKFRTLGIAEVSEALGSINPSKSTGCDNIPPRILRIAYKALAPSLTNLYNKCILYGSWPQQWRRGEWVPIFKKDDPLNVKNYRPITILNAVDKVFKQLLSKQVTEYMDPYLSDKLTAYRRKHSCETTLVRLVEEWKRAVDAKEEVAVLSTDMFKAFDSFYPPLMLSKLRAYGFTGHALQLLRSYFTDTKNRVRLGETWDGNHK